MKKLEELTEQEILALTEAQVEFLINLRKAEEGIKFVKYPNAPEMLSINSPDVEVFTCGLFGGNLAFTDFEELKGLIAYLENCKTKCSIDTDYDLENSKKFISAKLRKEGYSNDSWETVTSQKAYSNIEYKAIKSSLVANAKEKKAFRKELEKYESNISEAKHISTEIWAKVNEVKNKYYNLERHCVRFKNDYMPLAEENTEIAMKFMDKAYSLTADDKKYILDNYNN